MAVTPPNPLLLAMFLLLAAAPAPSAGKLFVVGDKKKWAQNVNYTTWPDQYHFHVGDWLQFKYEKSLYDVVQVADQAAYDKCDPRKPLVTYDRGTGYVFRLNHTGRFYFICSRGYCYGGMKVTVLVEDDPRAAPAPAPAPSAAAPRGTVTWVLAAAAASLCAAAALGLPFPA